MDGTSEMSDIEVKVTTLPKCDVCLVSGVRPQKVATYDARSTHGQWGYMCEEHFQEQGVGLGLGRGQRLITE